MAQKQPLNEATLEERIGAVLRSTFPTFKSLKVKHQESFSIKLGHHNVLVDLKEPSKYPSRAIFDILLTTEDEHTNLILLELKKENLIISDEDIEQGLSYSRLIHPMPPITLISNGSDNQFYDTYTKEKLDKQTIDFGFIKERIDNSFSLALSDFKKTVETLLNRNPNLIGQIINDISEKRFKKLKGDVSNLRKPICENFIIQREYVNEIYTKQNENHLIGVIGSAFSGKTTLFYDYFLRFHNHSKCIYYLDCGAENYSIIQQLSNHLTRSFGYSVDKQKVREWLITSLHDSNNITFTFLLDNFDSNVSDSIKEEVIELIDLLDGSPNTIVFTIDAINFKSIAKDKFRNYSTFFGSESHLINLQELSLDEFYKNQDELMSMGKCFLDHGAYFSLEYRQPRVLRLIAAYFSSENKNLEIGQAIKIPAVPDYELIQLFAANSSFSSELKELFKKLTIAFIKDRKSHVDVKLNLASHFGGISLKSINKVFEKETDELFKSGFVTKHELGNSLTIVYPKIPELISFYGINYISSILIEKHHNLPVDEFYKLFEEYCAPFINNDIVGTGVLLNIAHSGHIDLFSQLVLYMLKLKPTKSKISDGTKVAMLIDEGTEINIEFKGEEFDEDFTGNYYPYLVLSQLAGYPLKLENAEQDNEYDFHIQLLIDLASSPNLIVRISNFSFNNIPPIESFEFEKIGTVVSGKNGIIEPIVQSIQKCFFIIPDQIEKLYEFAFDHRLFPVIWRVYLALRNEVNSVDSMKSEQASKFMERFNKEFPLLFEEIVES